MELERNTGSLQEIGENLILIMRALRENQDLLKLLANTDKDPLAGPEVPLSVIREKNLIRVIPMITEEEKECSRVVLRIIKGYPNENNEFRNFVVHIEVFVPLTQWIIKDKSLRPFLILGEIQKTLKDLSINGMGKLRGGSFNLNFLTEEISCYEQEFDFTTYA